ncbi:MAG TPA: TadE/TadG family type IV pilus assembly protein [Acidocella sp.]|nr:TadE/TadG family type IV pilus assembly protein [Acidocella sp.]
MSRFAVTQRLTSGALRHLLFARRFWLESRADTAVEFAMIGSAFFLFIFGIFVVSIDMFWQMALDDAVRNATRQVQIGNITTGPAFAAAVCQEFGAAAPNCTGSLQYSVQGGSYFGTGGITATSFSSSGNLGSAATFTGATATATGAPVFLLVQVAYPLPFKVLAVPGGVATENGTPSLYSAVATVMEP